MSVETALGLQAQSWALEAAGELEPARVLCREALHQIEATQGAHSADAANILNDLAELELGLRDLQAARACVLRARAIEDALVDEFRGADAARIRSKTLSVSGEISRRSGDYAAAQRELLGAIEVVENEFGERSEELAEVRNNLGVLYKYWGRFDDGLALYRQALATFVETHGEESLPVAGVYHNIGGILHARGDFAAAEQPAREAWRISRCHFGDDDVRTIADAVAYAAVLDGLERYALSEGIYRRGLAVFERTYGVRHPETAAVLHNLAAVVAARGDPENAIALYRRALAVKAECALADSGEIALTCNNLGKLLMETGRTEEAVVLLRRAVTELQDRLTDGHPHLEASRRNLEAALKARAEK
jgi:tetratricopeptide (TPR) repeat protein